MSEQSHDNRHEIIMCMGSACFTRGNNRNVEIVKDYLKTHNLEARVTFKGCLCNNRCKTAPTITINGQNFEKVVPQSVKEILDHVFASPESTNEPA